MKLEKDMEYKEFLSIIKFMIDKKKSDLHEKNRIFKSIDFLTEIDDKEMQQFIVNGVVEINNLVKREFNVRKPIEYDKLYESACCLFELAKTNYQDLKKFTPKETASICYYAWALYDEDLEKYQSFIFDKQLCKEILKKFPKDGELQMKAYRLVEKDMDEFGNYEGFIKNNIQKIKEIDKEELCRIINDDDLEITLPF